MPRHLVTVWNPSYARDAMDEHLRVLREWGRRFAEGSADEDDVYVWWGKVKSSNRQQPMAHRADALAVGDQPENEEVQLYLTDYRALYVADVIDVRGDDLPPSEDEHVPSYYRVGELRCDLWFRLADIRRLVVDDTLGVVEELKKLANVHYNDRPVSIYGGMVDLPLVVTRPDGARFFDPDERETLAGDRLWAEFDAEQGSGISTVERDLRDNRFGETLWYALEPAARVFLATGERLYRDHRADAAFDFSLALTSLAKAVEVQANALLRAAAAKLSPAARRANVNGRTVDLTEHRSLSLGELARAIGGERELNEGLGRVLARATRSPSHPIPTSRSRQCAAVSRSVVPECAAALRASARAPSIAGKLSRNQRALSSTRPSPSLSSRSPPIARASSPRVSERCSVRSTVRPPTLARRAETDNLAAARRSSALPCTSTALARLVSTGEKSNEGSAR